jgi:hypothetical protein
LEERSIHRVRVRTLSQIVTMPWQSAQDFIGHALAAYPTTHRVVEQQQEQASESPPEPVPAPT